VLSHLHNLTHLRIKGAPSNAIPQILASLPVLVSLDTDYNVSGFVKNPETWMRMPLLETLTVRTDSIDNGGPRDLWLWSRQLIPRRSLESFRLQSFSTLGDTSVPRGFILLLAQVHGATLRCFLVGPTQLSLQDMRCVCDMFPKLEELSCAMAVADAKSIRDVTSRAYNLRVLRLNIQWFQMRLNVKNRPAAPFTIDDARSMMLRDRSRLRLISFGPFIYEGKWVLKSSPAYPGDIYFAVSQTGAQDVQGENTS